jgi:pimeloyl-ACP methyl ester carboxylesterase
MTASDLESRIAEIQARDGYRLKYRVWTRAGAGPRATLLLLNGIMSHSLWFAPLAPALLDAGFKLVGADRRGTGENDAARGDAPSGKALIDDAVAIAGAERVAGAPTFVVGWCWGAILGINVAAELGDAAAGLALLAPGLYPTAALKDRMAEQERLMREHPADYPRDRACVESPISDDMFTAGPARAGFIAGDTRRLARFTPAFLDAMAKLAFGARLKLPRLTLPLLLILASDDLATDNAETERGIAQMTAGRVTPRYIQGAHGLQFDAPGELARAITAWVDRACVDEVRA